MNNNDLQWIINLRNESTKYPLDLRIAFKIHFIGVMRGKQYTEKELIENLAVGTDPTGTSIFHYWKDIQNGTVKIDPKLESLTFKL